MTEMTELAYNVYGENRLVTHFCSTDRYLNGLMDVHAVIITFIPNFSVLELLKFIVNVLQFKQ